MKFILTGHGQQGNIFNWLIRFLAFFLISFWLGKLTFFYYNFGFDPQNVTIYFKGTQEFPLNLDFSSWLEQVHQDLFFYGMFWMLVGSFLLRNTQKKSMLILYVFTGCIHLLFFLSPLGLIFDIFDSSRIFLISGYLSHSINILAACLFFYPSIKKKFKTPLNQRKPAVGLHLSLWILLFTGVGIWMSSILLFHHKIGWNLQSVKLKYFGDEQQFINPADWQGLSEIAIPHFMAMGVFLFALMHFLNMQNKPGNFKVFLLVFITAFMDIMAGFAIRYISVYFFYFKLLMFAAFTAGMAYLLINLALMIPIKNSSKLLE